ncbi:MAG: ATP-binding cassette domain-containing protein [Chloroflexi bacterium]|uniref:ATP-binding cassette domain-containing protein n=1 Tax=Candidatus Chlorohelix allophototropha TaxID=3003348 RepID=A0A8T7M567_9CHLR|nr:ATP-binding cassette domain-containing protein [Chloroflexota bacterium]WJW69124.1 ATP-binding cassette domain-containing protein [Chloroflexota bacterium L227-S17]
MITETAPKQTNVEVETPLLVVENLTRIYGHGCPRCLELTGPETDSNTCSNCGTLVACADVNFEVYEGEILGVVGESGSGKTTLLRCLYGDVAPSKGQAFLKSFGNGRQDIFQASSQQARYLQDFVMGMVRQNPAQGLHLHITAGGNIAERLLAAEWRNVAEIRERSGALLNRMEVPLNRMDHYPAFFSGGMQQRVQIAKALANHPVLLLLDEMTTGLDVSVQAGVIDLVKEVQRESGVAIVVVSHDLGVIRLLSERTLVMKNGRVVENGLTDQILEDPQHPYTQLLVSSSNS